MPKKSKQKKQKIKDPLRAELELGSKQFAYLLYLTWLEKKGLDPFVSPHVFLEGEFPAAEPLDPAHTDHPTSAP